MNLHWRENENPIQFYWPSRWRFVINYSMDELVQCVSDRIYIQRDRRGFYISLYIYKHRWKFMWAGFPIMIKKICINTRGNAYWYFPLPRLELSAVWFLDFCLVCKLYYEMKKRAIFCFYNVVMIGAFYLLFDIFFFNLKCNTLI